MMYAHIEFPFYGENDYEYIVNCMILISFL